MRTPTLIAAQPIAQPEHDGALAPWPLNDRQPIVIGPGLSLNYVSAVFRLSIVGYRQQYVDLLEELLEKDPHAYSVVSKRVLGVAGGRLELTPAECPAGSNDAALAQEISDRCTEMLKDIPDLTQHLAALSWATYYAIVGAETHWQRDGLTGFIPDRLSFIHSRRLSYPVSNSWDLYIWDLGAVLPGQNARTNGSYGLRVADAPGKFIIHAPQIRGTYPTREGLGRQIAYWLVLKLIATRGAPQYLERFAKPWPEATYTTSLDDTKRVASKEDIADAKQALRAMGAGSLSHWVHADTIELDLRTADQGSSPKLTYAEWIAICNGEVSKAGLGGTLTTEVGTTGGNRSLGDTQKKGEQSLLANDAKLLAATVKRDLVAVMVALNWPGVPKRLVPNVAIHVDDAPDPLKLIEKGSKAASAGMPVDADKLAEQAGVPLVAPGDTKARRLFPVMAQKAPEQFDEDLAARAADIAKKYPAAAETETTNGTKPKDGSGAATDDETPVGETAATEDDETTPPAGEEPVEED
jgi:phage gp29-like protein